MPKDFRKKTFQKILRGYSPEEVDSYLAYVNDEYRKLEKRCFESERKLTLAAQKIQAYEFELNKNNNDFKSEEELAESLKKAEGQADAILDNARKEAEKTVNDAREQAANEANSIIAEAQEYSNGIKNRADALSKTAAAIHNEIISFRDVMFELYNSHIEQIEDFVNKADSFSDRTDALYRCDDETDEETVDSDDDDTETTEEDNTVENEVKAGEDIYIDLENELDSDEDGQSYIDEALGLDDDSEEDVSNFADYEDDSQNEYDANDANEQPEQEASDDTAENEISDEDIERQRQLDRFFGILDDDELLSAEDESKSTDENSDFADDEAPTRVLNIGEALRNARKNNENSDFKDDNSDSGEYVDIDSIFSGKEKRDMSLTDEFDIVYSDANVKKSVDEIRKQPTITASETPKKNIKYFKK